MVNHEGKRVKQLCGNIKCMQHLALEDKIQPVEKRIMKKMTFTNGIEGCWIFTGSKNNSGYGQIYHNGKLRLVHRVMYEIKNCVNKDGNYVMHKCDNPYFSLQFSICLSALLVNPVYSLLY